MEVDLCICSPKIDLEESKSIEIAGTKTEVIEPTGNIIANFLDRSSSSTASIDAEIFTDVIDYAFYSNSSLKGEIRNLKLSGVKNIGKYAFYYNQNLEKIESSLPLIIDENAFYYCSKAQGNIVISDEQTVIKSNTFRSCSKLTFKMHDNITSIEQYAFNNCQANDCTSLPKSLTSIGTYAFYQNTKMKITEIPQHVKSIPNYCFASCQLESIKIYDECSFVGQYAFRYNSKLQSIELGKGIKTLYSYCFANCASLTSITIHATTPPTLVSTAFSSDNALDEIRVPASVLEEYKSATNWSQYADIMIPIEGE